MLREVRRRGECSGKAKGCYAGVRRRLDARAARGLLLRALYACPRVGAPLRAHRRAEATLHAATPRRPAPLQHAPPRCIAPPSSLTARGAQVRMRARVSAAALWAPRRSAMSRYARRSAAPLPRLVTPHRATPRRPATPRYAPLPAARYAAPRLRLAPLSETWYGPMRPTAPSHALLRPVARLRPDLSRCRDLPTRPIAPSCAPLRPTTARCTPLRKGPMPPTTPRDTPLRPATSRRAAAPAVSHRCATRQPAMPRYVQTPPVAPRYNPLRPACPATPRYAPLRPATARYAPATPRYNALCHAASLWPW